MDGHRRGQRPAQPETVDRESLTAEHDALAGEVGDGAILNWLAPDDVPRCVAIVREAAKKTGRDPEAIEISARLFVHVDPPSAEADAVARRHIAAYLNVPVYRAFHEWLGRTPELGPMWEAWTRGDRKGALAAIPDRVVNELVLRGSVDEIRARVRRFFDAGLDTAFLAFQTSEQDRERKREVVRGAMRELAPGRD